MKKDTFYPTTISLIPATVMYINFYDTSSRAKIQNVVNRAIEFGEEFDDDLVIITAKNKIVNVRALGRVKYDEAGKPELIYGAFQDITDRKKMELQFIQQILFMGLVVILPIIKA